MKQALLGYLKGYAGNHVAALVIASGLFVLGSSWLKEHDARLMAESTVKQTQTQIDSLKQQFTATDAAQKSAIATLQKQRLEVKTPAQAVQAVKQDAAPEVKSLNVEALPDAPQAVKVDALPLFQTLNTCKQCEANLAAVTSKLDLQQKIDADKDVQIKALRKKPGFWKRVKSTAITLGIGAAAGYVIAHR